MARHRALIPLMLYVAVALADAGAHLHEASAFGMPRFAPDRVIVAMDAGLFWPVDFVAAALLAMR